MDLRARLQAATKEAMKAKEAHRLSTLRLIAAAVKDREIAARGQDGEGGDLREADLIAILSRMVKQRQESAKAYEEGGRLELAGKEQQEIEIIREFLPRQLSEDEIKSAVADVIKEYDASGLKDMGKCMGALKERYSGAMDFGRAGKMMKEQLI